MIITIAVTRAVEDPPGWRGVLHLRGYDVKVITKQISIKKHFCHQKLVEAFIDGVESLGHMLGGYEIEVDWPSRQ